jgi:xanthine/uracil permease
LFFMNEGWKFRKQIQWLMAIITNLVLALLIANLGLSVHTAIANAAFVEEGHQPEDFASSGWVDLAKVCFYTYRTESEGELTLPVL